MEIQKALRIAGLQGMKSMLTNQHERHQKLFDQFMVFSGVTEGEMNMSHTELESAVKTKFVELPDFVEKGKMPFEAKRKLGIKETFKKGDNICFDKQKETDGGDEDYVYALHEINKEEKSTYDDEDDDDEPYPTKRVFIPSKDTVILLSVLKTRQWTHNEAGSSDAEYLEDYQYMSWENGYAKITEKGLAWLEEDQDEPTKKVISEKEAKQRNLKPLNPPVSETKKQKKREVARVGDESLFKVYCDFLRENFLRYVDKKEFDLKHPQFAKHLQNYKYWLKKADIIEIGNNGIFIKKSIKEGFTIGECMKLASTVETTD